MTMKLTDLLGSERLIVFTLIMFFCSFNVFCFEFEYQNLTKVYHVAKTGSDQNTGDSDQPFLTINKASELARPGDSIIVHEGIYRERVAPLFGGNDDLSRITYKAAASDQVIIRGSNIWRPEWKKEEENEDYYSASLNEEMFTDDSYITDKNPFKVQLAHSEKILRGKKGPKTLGQIFVNGERYQERNTPYVLRNEKTWYYNHEQNRVYVHFEKGLNISSSEIEITTKGALFKPHKTGLGYITVSGFTFEHCANQQIAFGSDIEGANHGQPNGAIDVHHGHHWIIENNTVRFAKGIGINVGGALPISNEKLSEPVNYLAEGTIVRNNIVEDNGAIGIGAFMPRRGEIGDSRNRGGQVVIEGNKVRRNNYLWFDDVVNAGIKVTDCKDCLIKGNIIEDNYTRGIWIDARWPGLEASNNYVINNYVHGIFVEFGNFDQMDENGFVPIDDLCYVHHNIVAGTKAFTESRESYSGNGIKINSASGVVVTNNLIYNNEAKGVLIQYAPERRNGKVHTSHNTVIMNVILANGKNIEVNTENKYSFGNMVFNNVLDQQYDGVSNAVMSDIECMIDHENARFKLSLPVNQSLNQTSNRRTEKVYSNTKIRLDSNELPGPINKEYFGTWISVEDFIRMK